MASIIDSFLQTKYPDVQDKTELTKYYTNGEGKTAIQKATNRTEIITKLVSYVTQSATAVTTAKIGPAVIVAGAASGVTNPAYMVALGTAFKGALLAILSVASLLTDELEQDLGSNAVIAFRTSIETATTTVNTL